MLALNPSTDGKFVFDADDDVLLSQTEYMLALNLFTDGRFVDGDELNPDADGNKGIRSERKRYGSQFKAKNTNY